MLARLQRFITIGLLAIAVTWGAAFSWWGHPVVGALGFAFILAGYALFLAAEFLMLALVKDIPSVPRARPAELLRAWWGEVLTAPRIFCWRQPFRSHAEPDHLPYTASQAHGRHGIVFVHGFVCNRGFWNPWMSRLRRDGIAFVAVDLEPLFGSIGTYAAIIDRAVTRVEAATGRAPVLVAHSMGGLAVRHWLAEHAADRRVRRVVTIGTPHGGTWLARFGHTVNGREMAMKSAWLAKLAERTAVDRYTVFTCYFSNCDNIVFPPSTGMLPGADNRMVHASAHVQMAFREEIFEEVGRWLQRDPI